MRIGPSAANVFSGQSGTRSDGTGNAAILDTHQDITPYINQIYQQKRQVETQRLADLKQKEKDWNAYLGKIKFDDIYAPHQQELTKDLNNYYNSAMQMRLAGNDIADVYGESGSKLRELEQNALNKKAKSDEIKTRTNDILKHVDSDKTGKLDKGYTLEYVKKLQSMPVDDAYEVMSTESPFRSTYHPVDTLERVVPTTFERIKETGATTRKQTGLDEQVFKDALQVDFLTNQGQEDFAAWQTQNPQGSYEDYENQLLTFAKTQVKAVDSETRDEPRQASSNTGGTLGQTPTGVQVVATYDPSVSEDPSGNINSVQIIYDEQNAKKVSLQDEQGKTRTIVSTPTAKKRPNGEWYIEADVSETVEIPYSTKQIEENEALIALGQEPLPKEKKTVTKTLNFPIDNQRGKQGNLNYQVMSALTGKDFQQWVGDQTGGQKQSSGNYVIKGQQYTLEQLKGMGYTEDQVAKYKQ